MRGLVVTGAVLVVISLGAAQAGSAVVPARPTALSAKPTSSSRVVLGWSDNSGNESGFRVERKAGACASPLPWVRIATRPADATSHVNTGLTPATVYSYRLQAYGAAGASGYSNCAAATTAPAGTPNAPQELQAMAVSGSRVTLSWRDTATDETAFKVYRQSGTGPWTLLATLAPGARTHSDSTAVANQSSTTYAYQVKACNSAGCSPATRAAAVPHRPTGLTATPAAAGVELHWSDQAAGESGLQLQRKEGGCSVGGEWALLADLGPDAETAGDLTVSVNQTYAYKVRARTASPPPVALAYSQWSTCVTAVEPGGFVRRQGNRIVVGSAAQPIALRGINFNNDCWADYTILNHSVDHAEIDFARVAGMGMNVIRSMLTYKFFERDDEPYRYRQEGWQWLDREIALARKYGLYLILDMQIPQASARESGAATLWNDSERRARLKALWQAIAQRYRHETTVAAYDILNEPCPGDDLQPWKELANELIATIRGVDHNHLLIVELADCRDQHEHFLVNDQNVMYDTHAYAPHKYTHMYHSGIGMNDGGFYPDPGVRVPPWDIELAGSADTPSVPSGESGWSAYESEPYTVSDPEILLAEPVFKCGTNQGQVFFDDFTISEYDGDDTLLREMHHDIETVPAEEEWRYTRSSTPFYSFPRFWEEQKAAGELGVKSIAESGHWGDHSLALAGVTTQFNLFNYSLYVATKPGYHYRIKGWMKGSGVTGESCRLGLDFYRPMAGRAGVPFDQGYLADNLTRKLLAFGNANNVPVNVGEFGLMYWCFADNLSGCPANRGGLQWVRDMVEIFSTNRVNFQYFGYHSHDFGLYRNEDALPDPASANQGLIDLWQELLAEP